MNSDSSASSTSDPAALGRTLRVEVRAVRALFEERALVETEIEQWHEEQRRAVEEEYRTATERNETEFASGIAEADGELAQAVERIESRFRTTSQEAQAAEKSERAEIESRAQDGEKAARDGYAHQIWLAESIYEAAEPLPRREYEQSCKAIQATRDELAVIEREAAEFLSRCRREALIREVSADEPGQVIDVPSDEAEPTLQAATAEARQRLDALRALKLPRLGTASVLTTVGGLLVAGAVALAGWLTGWSPNWWVAAAAVGTAVLWTGAAIFLHLRATARIRSHYDPLLEAVHAAILACRRALIEAARQRDRKQAEIVRKRNADLKQAAAQYRPMLAVARQRGRKELQRINEQYPALLAEIEQTRDDERRAAEAAHQRRTAELNRLHAEQTEAARKMRDDALAHIKEEYESRWETLTTRWCRGLDRAVKRFRAIAELDESLYPDAQRLVSASSRTTESLVTDIRFGHFRLDLSQLPGGLSQDVRLRHEQDSVFDLPALYDLPYHGSILLECDGRTRRAAVETLQALMLRLLTTLPPGKVRFTIIDPVGLGQNFAGFMHLADYEEQLVNSRIWTEERHIEQRLADLTEHMETVIQKYLRNEFPTIMDYNVHAGEVAEPYRFLVIADLPINFNDASAQRLMSIVNSGPRCGVHALIAYDRRQPLPEGLRLEDLERHCTRLVFEGSHIAGTPTPLKGRGDPDPGLPGGDARSPKASSASTAFPPGKPGAMWQDPDFEPYPLTLDAPPDEETLTRLMHRLGREAKDSTRVEVPFEHVAPPPQRHWTADATNGFRVPIGRAGATKLQHLSLGEGTAQHVLIAGKTGSGKSTLLHALITNTALWYSPEEVEVYLVDFKKGVEFKTYAVHDLPHARAVAIESDREFGVSVLHRLDAELKHRGAIFRDLGVQDLAGYRRLAPGSAGGWSRVGGGAGMPSAAHPPAEPGANGVPMPRCLLIIDEFQEFFVEDDRIAQEAMLLLDRLVRQGRAFGIHVILGSQTLSGAYTLARSTIGQMAVRIALQCSETDSYLILSEENAAARLLSRPGEAIYNDANGMVEGNSPFQIVWIPDDVREKQLQRIASLTKDRGIHRSEPLIVFEGNVPADLARNEMLQALLRRPTWGPPPAAPCAWLGEPIEIKDATAAVFRRHSGHNLLVVGQRDEAALALTTASLVSLAAQYAPDDVRIHLLDGTAADHVHAGHLKRLAERLPHGVNIVEWRDVEATIRSLGEEVERRHADSDFEQPTVYLVIHGLQRYRMLRPVDEFSFSAGESGPRLDEAFQTVLRDGPAVGVHTIAWCDTVNNLERGLGRQGLREFEMRVLFQMGATDSSHLLDSPAASKLGLHRAIYHSEESGQMEKFRPYALPDETWLADLQSRLGDPRRRAVR